MEDRCGLKAKIALEALCDRRRSGIWNSTIAFAPPDFASMKPLQAQAARAFDAGVGKDAEVDRDDRRKEWPSLQPRTEPMWSSQKDPLQPDWDGQI
jgi:hypothetical protein